MTSPASPPVAGPGELAAALPGVLAAALRVDPGAVAVTGLRRLTGGASRVTWAFDARTPAGSRALILRTGPADEPHADMELEARAQAAAAAAGAPVPHVLTAANSTAALGVAEFIETELMPATADLAGPLNFRTRVAANALRIVERELCAPPATEVAAALAALGCANEAALAAAIRAGRFDDRADELTGCLRTLVRYRLAAAHPGYDR